MDEGSDDEETRKKVFKKKKDEEEKVRNEASQSDYLELSALVWKKVYIS